MSKIAKKPFPSYHDEMRILSLLFVLSVNVFAAGVLVPGAYQSGAESTVELKARSDGDWDVSGASGNEKGQVCELKGKLPKAGGPLRFADDKEKCQLRVEPKDRGFEIIYQNDVPCRDLCPGALSFEGPYTPDKPECASVAVARRRSEARRLFDKKDYRNAREIFAQLNRECGDLLSETDRGWLANDLALASHKMGDDAGCRLALKPVKALIDTYEANDGFDGLGYDKFQQKVYEKIVRASKVNLKLCTGK